MLIEPNKIVNIALFYLTVPSANKKDTRTIEHIQNDIQAKKKQKKLLDTAMSDAIAAAGTSKESN